MAAHKPSIRPYRSADRQAVIDLSMRAWDPVFATLREDTLPFVYDAFYPNGWQARQTADVGAFLESDGERVWVATEGEAITGYVGVRIHPEDCMGEVYIIAVDPVHQRKGIADALMAFAHYVIREAGMTMVMVETGGDLGHAAARATYEQAGYERWPVARYFKKL